MNSLKKQRYMGFTLIELSISVLISSILVLTTSLLLVGGHKSWNRVYNSAHGRLNQDTMAAIKAFTSAGMKSNRLSYRIYRKIDGDYYPAQPQYMDSQEMVFGEAVEFRYWDVELDENDSHGLVDEDKLATAYVLFYFEDDVLKTDYGPYPPGAVTEGGGERNTNGVTTVELTENVKLEDIEEAFSHTTVNGLGQGNVRINIELSDPQTGDTMTALTSVMLRNAWPK